MYSSFIMFWNLAHGAIKCRARWFSASLTLPHDLLNLVIVLLTYVLELLLKLGLHHHQLLFGFLHNLKLILHGLYSNSFQLSVPLCADLIQNPIMLLPAGLCMLIALSSTLLTALAQHLQLNRLLCLDLSQPLCLLLLDCDHLVFMLNPRCLLKHLLLCKDAFQFCIALVSHILQLLVVSLPAGHLLIG